MIRTTYQRKANGQLIATIGLLVTVYGLAVWFNDLKAARPESHGPWIFFVGGLLLAYMLFGWFGAVIKESRAGLYSAQMDRSFRWGMTWFIFSEVMFFIAFFGALFYVRVWAGPWLAGEGPKGIAHMLWPNFEFAWPLLNNPDPKLYPAPKGTISPWGLPLVNTILLVSSSVTITIAHHALRKGHRGALKLWLAITVLLGLAFLGFQAEEYIHAYKELGLTLGSGVYGATFFMLTGFHGRPRDHRHHYFVCDADAHPARAFQCRAPVRFRGGQLVLALCGRGVDRAVFLCLCAVTPLTTAHERPVGR